MCLTLPCALSRPDSQRHNRSHPKEVGRRNSGVDVVLQKQPLNRLQEERTFMRGNRYAYVLFSLAIALSLLLQGAGGAKAAHSNATKLKGSIVIGQITSQTGAFSIYGTEQIEGFKAGLAYATKGTNKVDSAKLVVKTYNDVPASSSAGIPDPATAVTDAKTAITNDHAQILQCCASSASALAVAGVAAQYQKILMVAPAADDTISG